ncbi:CYFA0S05e01838g1_1 [Cyberlindnera fabianii]|uniref:CYFA0S05e01838g1_1 n=1 Tax=Cyberlindnera fabianii TaxID=36022 RepID=A0A061AYW9_CYBFA|nr:D-amino-acid oxidase [Cyberlindnera fabianii]CDR40559.1 CYFA0S05e01838g1_1 [Cyberlindnera fabianii]
MSEVVVVGAGVIGLTSALVLAEKGYKVRVIAAHFPTDPLNSKYTSPWAGAHFRPFPSHTDKDFEDSKLTRETYNYFKTLAKEEPESSVRWIEGVDWLEDQGIYGATAKGYYEGINELRELPKEALPKGVNYAARYDTWVLNSPFYIQYLMRKLTFKYGVEFVKTELISLKQLCQVYPNAIVVNASGTGLQYDGGIDPDSFLIRGQTLLLRVPQDCPYLNKTITHQSKEGLWTFVIPRPCHGGLILGGTKQLDDYQATPKDEDTAKLVERAKVLYPEVFIDGKLDIRNINVGFRPARKGGIRIEAEKQGKDTIVHAYGAGGMGYELSYGVAKKVAKLVDSVASRARL